MLGALVANASLVGAATPDAITTGSVCAVAECPYHGPTKSVSFTPKSPKAIAHGGAQGGGYRLVASDGGIFSYGNAAFDGSTGGMSLNRPIVAMAATADGGGYWLVASDGGIFSYGDATFYGSTGGMHLNQPIVSMAADPATGGYWLVASDGGIFSYHAGFFGSPGGSRLNKPIVGMASTPDGGGYWLVASDGGIFSYGDATFYGSTGGTPLNKPIVGMASTPDGGGYWLVASDGGIFSYGDATFYGSTGGTPLNKPIVGMADAPPHIATSPGAVSTASLTITVTNLPASTPADVEVTDPNDAIRTLTKTTTISPAAPGTWSVVADPVSAAGDTYYPATQTINVTLAPGAAGAVSVAYSQVVADTTSIATSSAIESLSAPDSNGTITATVNDPGGVIKTGSTLVAPEGTADPEGLLLDVTSLSANAGVDTLTGTQGSLTDIGPQADVVMDTSALGGSESFAKVNGEQARVVPDASAQNVDDPLSCSGNVSGSVSGSVSFSPSVHFEVHWGGILHPGTFTAQMTMSGTEQASLNSEVDAAATCSYDQSIPPEPVILAVIDVQIGPVPVVITPKLSFDLEADGNVEGEVEASATQTLTATAGLSWDGSSLSPVSSLSNSFSSQAPTVTLDGSLHAQVGPKLSLDLYGVAGPYVTADASATLNASLTSTPWWTLTGGFEAGGGIELDVFDIDFSQGDPSIFSKTWTIAQASTPAPLTITTQSLAGGEQGDSYSQTLQAAGGTAPYSWTLASGSLPAGLALSSSGTISGNPTATGVRAFAVQVTDSKGATASDPLTIDIASSGSSPLAISTSTLPSGTVDAGYSATLQATGGQAPYDWSVSSGSLPAGLSLDVATGSISGTPTSTGAQDFTISVTDAATDIAEQSLSILIIAAPPVIETGGLKNGTIEVAYQNYVEADVGGTQPPTWQITAGQLPPGLEWATDDANGADGAVVEISGTPTTPGTWSVTFGVTDMYGQSTSRQFTITVSAQPTSTNYTTLTVGTSILSKDLDFQYSVNNDDVLTRESTSGGTAGSLSVTLTPSLFSGGCPTPSTYSPQVVSPDDTNVLVECTANGNLSKLFLIDMTTDTAEPVDVDSQGTQSGSSFDEPLYGEGISSDNTRVLFEDQLALTPDAASAQAQTNAYGDWSGLYVRNLAAGTTTFVPQPTQPSGGDANIYLQGAALSSDGYTVDRLDVWTLGSGLDWNTEITHVRLSGGPVNASAGCTLCSIDTENPYFINEISASADGMEVAYEQDDPVYSADETTYVEYSDADLWDLYSGSNAIVVSQQWGERADLSPDGTKLLLEQNAQGDDYLTEQDVTNRLGEYSADPSTGTVGPAALVGGPPDGLPLTGSEVPIAVSDSGQFLFGSTETNLLPVGELPSGDPDTWDIDYLSNS
jgi:hypothetical protein